ncbi:MAG: iron-sulfur cluster assembly accessory protein [Sandaracinaceae bacterium]|nr:iron-sulfur cluster assembly accessory protein [Sandaracinaceae bacterium]
MTEVSFTPISEELPIAVTPRAIAMGKQKLAEADEEGVIGIRVGIKGGGCSGLQYHFEFADSVREKRDIVAELDGLTLLVDRKSLKFLAGAVLDWNDGLVEYGFRWKNPNSAKDCGCGTSFHV